MQIKNCTTGDIPAMIKLYEIAKEFQKEKSNWHWENFEPAQLKKEIEEDRQWKIEEGKNIACIFLTAYDDPYIWGDRNNEPSIYLHRIVTNPAYRGKNYTAKIIEWAKEFGKQRGKEFIRIDTWAENKKLTDYYISCGFSFLGITTPNETEHLPEHYKKISLSLLEIRLE